MKRVKNTAISQNVRSSEQTGLFEDVPAHPRGVGLDEL